MSNTSTDRWLELNEIHQLKDKSSLNERGYRELLFKLTGYSSAKKLFQAQRLDVIEFLTLLVEVINESAYME